MWSVIITGTVENTDIQTAARRLSAMLKIKPTQAHKLIANAPVTIKRDLDETQADRYRQAMLQAGVAAEIRQQAEAGDTAGAADVQRPAATAPRSARRRSALSLVLGCLVVILTIALAGASWTLYRLWSFKAEAPVAQVFAEDFETVPTPRDFRCAVALPAEAQWDITDLSFNRVAGAPDGLYRYQNNLARPRDTEVHLLSIGQGVGHARIDATDRPATLVLLSSGQSRWELSLTRSARVKRVIVHPNVETVRFQRVDPDYAKAVLQHVLRTGAPSSIADIPVARLEADARCLSAYPGFQGPAMTRTQVRSELVSQLLGQRESSFQTLAPGRDDAGIEFRVPLSESSGDVARTAAAEPGAPPEAVDGTS